MRDGTFCILSLGLCRENGRDSFYKRSDDAEKRCMNYYSPIDHAATKWNVN
jgi:hypothetical protein